ncbi:GAF domain-containing protein [Amycolatopsis marina]|uniref:GAF domain-containing protein n=1 Tax=Amycolatopsis marina TaxID=490629 RepID=A0A1I1BG33_9PSEU|nr:GAF and ANTAR domain-containing protein [Amycolatopsis marina]SFB48616.1 GAF domain-containing protein [Amycolatopsis marina]
MAERQDWKELATSLAHMARDLQRRTTVQETLDRIAEFAVEVVDGCEAAGILVLRGGRVLTMARTDNVVQASDRIQGELREGPCFDAAYYKRESFRIGDMSTSVRRWPRYAPKARELGVGSMMGFLLFVEGDNELGALDLYSSRPGAFTEHSEHVGWLLASHSGVALSTARHEAQLREAIATRQDIGEALGILMERHMYTEQDAFTLLTKVSQDLNIKLRDIAHTIVTTGEIPSTS